MLSAAAIGFLLCYLAHGPGDSTATTWSSPRLLDEIEPLEDAVMIDGFWDKVRHTSSGVVLLLVEPGLFHMGIDSHYREEGPRHMVAIDRRFLISETPVTVGQWRRFQHASGYITDLERMGEAETLSAAIHYIRQPPRNVHFLE
jgi:formylglycine-generating enzyme required for sulfatase activity